METRGREDQLTNERYITDAWSEDGMYYWSVDVKDHIGISCGKSGLRDNTAGRTGWFSVNLHSPGGKVPEGLLEGARQFAKAVQGARDELKKEQEDNN